MTAASKYLCRNNCKRIAASSSQGTGAQNLANAFRKRCAEVSGMAFGPSFCNCAAAAAEVSPAGMVVGGAVEAVLLEGIGHRGNA